MLALLAEDDFAEVQTRRRERGADKLDEVWSGIHHLQPVGPQSRLQQAIAVRLQPLAADRGLVPVLGAYDPRDLWSLVAWTSRHPTLRGDQAASAALAVKIVSDAEETPGQLPSCASDHVGELVIIDVETRTVHWFALVADDYEPVHTSRLIDCSPAELAEGIESPKPGGP